MQLATRYALVGMGALALLSAVHWVREQRLPLDPVAAYLVGVGPNFAAAIAITFVILGGWADQQRSADAAAMHARFRIAAAISAIGLIGWEFVQWTSARFVFDWQDMLATLLGIAISLLLFRAVTTQ